MAVFLTTKIFINSSLLKHCKVFLCTTAVKLNETVTSNSSELTTGSSSQQKQQQQEDEKYETDIKVAILSASLQFVNEMGWSRNAVIAGAKHINYPGTVHGLFPSAGSELVQFFYTKCNTELANDLKDNISNYTDGRSPISGSEIARAALEKRIRMIIPYKKRWPQAIAILSMPQNVPSALATLLTLADDVCYYAGDRSVDLTWYSRRIGIAAIYKMTELYMLQDNSEDHTDTWQFLKQRITEASTVNKFMKSSDSVSQNAKETITSAITMARNILGIDWRR